jgi:hypothetical protein
MIIQYLLMIKEHYLLIIKKLQSFILDMDIAQISLVKKNGKLRKN